MPTIVTLTMNPAIDLSTSVERVEPRRKLRCSAGRRDPGGGGVNIARVVQRLGAEALAVYPAGGLVGQLLRQLVCREGVESLVVPISGETREDLTLFDETAQEQYRFIMPGPHLHGVEWMACLKTLANLPVRPDVICASGSLPRGVPDDFYARVVEIASGLGAEMVLDTSGAPLKAALDGKLHLIKPNRRELCELVGADLDDEPSFVNACRSLIEGRRLEAVALTLGARGALLVTKDGAWRATGPTVETLSVVGAGDSFLGAMVWARAVGKSLLDAFRYGAAGGSAGVLAAGTELCRPHDVHRMVELVNVEEIERPAVAAP